MRGNSVYKIPDGKLVKVSMDFDNDTILAISIFGDFFLYPEEGILKLEQSLSGKKIAEQELLRSINKAVHENNLELFGLSAQGLAKAILLAKGSAVDG